MNAVASPDFSAATRLRALRIIGLALGRTPSLAERPFDLETMDLVQVLFSLEKGFAIPLDADEAMDCADFDALLTLVEARIMNPGEDTPAPPCALYDFRSYRDAVGAPDFSRDPDWEIEPAVIAAAFPSAEAEATPRRSGLRDIGLGLLIGLGLILTASGWTERHSALPGPTEGVQAFLDAIR